MNNIRHFLLNFFMITLCLLFVQCKGEVKKEDLLKQRDKVQKNMTAVKEDVEEAVKLKEKYLAQQKEQMIAQLEERQLKTEVEISKLQDMIKNSQSVADQEINS